MSTRTSWIAVGVILAIGVLGIAWENTSRYLVRHRYTPEQTRLTEDLRTLLQRGEELPLEILPDLKVRAVREGTTGLQGWFYDPTGVVERGPVLVFAGRVLLGLDWPENPTPELFEETGADDVRAFVAGFEMGVDRAVLDPEAPVTVVAIRDGRAYAARLPPLGYAE